MSGIPADTWQPQTVAMDTTMGTIVLELYWRQAPKTCKNFAELCRRGYYVNTKFHRIIKDFMVQGGDPTGTGGLVTYTTIQVVHGLGHEHTDTRVIGQNIRLLL
ncbi:Peptidyl-prolyl cis-trans isomerase-like 1 [Liparis tanakae]|uniref:Peptidyl-prolyl cis-trans isomerase n=1 Tax=Liparis tanakae TaxID=230148 RepID=A0A4Z2J2B4_9TELE|nr:Peptidyl-prolyl cis-trans isomerase-like 1 [Liparis tanakae]